MRTRSQLRFGAGYWLDGQRAPSQQTIGLTPAARTLAAAVLEMLSKNGVTAELDKARRAHFRATRIPSRDTRLAIETHGDLVESFLIEQAERKAT